MNDDHITQSVNDLVSQAGDQSDKQPTPNFGLGMNPSNMPRRQSDQPSPPKKNSKKPDDQGNDQVLDDAMKSIGYGAPSDDINDPQPNISADAGVGNPSGASPSPTPDPMTAHVQAQPDDIAVPVDRELESIRQQALSQLSPIVNKLEQSPEEKYRTLMMLIQASDDQTLINAAYEAANAITDETKKAEALLGVVNEINYFTKKSANES